MSILFDLEDDVALITINRPEKLNALDPQAYTELSEAWIRVRDDDRIRVAVITGAGERAFCVGADVTSTAFRNASLAQFWKTQSEPLLNRGLEIWKPVVAAVNGYCLGGGMTLLMATDIRVAGEGATFALSEVKRGMIAANGGTQRVLDQLPYAIGMEMLLTGTSLDAVAAARHGLVNRVVPAADVVSEAMSYAHTIAGNAPLAVQAAKESALRSRGLPLHDGLRIEQAMAKILMSTADAAEGATAFAEKRSPRYTGA